MLGSGRLRRPQVVAFDIIETTFRIEPLDQPLQRLGLPPGSCRRLYAETLRDAMALACANRFAPFAEVMQGALAGLLSETGREAGEAELKAAASVLRELPPHADAAGAYAALEEAGLRVVALSNGAEAATRALLERAGMERLVDQVLSVEAVRLSKPRPEVYRYAAEAAKVAPGEMMLVACHPWDVQGAKAAGLMGGYVRRGRPFPASVMERPDLAGESLAEVASRILALDP